MQGNKLTMQIAAGVYFLLVALGLFLGVRLFSAKVLLENTVPIAIGLVVLWFLLIFAVMKYMQKNGTKKENLDEKSERED